MFGTWRLKSMTQCLHYRKKQVSYCNRTLKHACAHKLMLSWLNGEHYKSSQEQRRIFVLHSQWRQLPFIAKQKKDWCCWKRGAQIQRWWDCGENMLSKSLAALSSSFFPILCTAMLLCPEHQSTHIECLHSRTGRQNEQVGTHWASQTYILSPRFSAVFEVIIPVAKEKSLTQENMLRSTQQLNGCESFISTWKYGSLIIPVEEVDPDGHS